VLSLKAAVEGGRFGRLLCGNCSLKILRDMEYFRSNGGWRGTRKLDGGGVLSNQAIHHIDELIFVLGVPAAVRCDLWTLHHDIEAEDLASAVWRYGDDGPIVTLTATTNFPQTTWYLHLELEGTDGAYRRAAGGPVETPRTRWYLDGAWSDAAPEIVRPRWLNAMDNFAGALRDGAELVCDGRAGRRTQAVLDAMYRSAYDHGGEWVEVRPELG
jgi:UDP-N-acetyl-2-amino-2-deoxyglucuronate dehydrogenase